MSRVTEADIQQDAFDYLTNVDLTPGTDAWVSELGGDNAATRALLEGLVSRQSEAHGWNAIARTRLSHDALTRVNDHRVTIRISGFADLDVAAPETIRLAVPAAALVSARATEALGPDVVIVPARGSAALSGTLLTRPYERTVQSVEGGQLLFTLSDDGFVDTLGQSVAADAVSYTHLTLPTICSV